MTRPSSQPRRQRPESDPDVNEDNLLQRMRDWVRSRGPLALGRNLRALRVLWYLFSCANYYTSRCYPTVDQIAANTGIHYTHVKLVLAGLRQGNVIKTIKSRRGRGKGAIHELFPPEYWTNI